jgi:hypothetical protein
MAAQDTADGSPTHMLGNVCVSDVTVWCVWLMCTYGVARFLCVPVCLVWSLLVCLYASMPSLVEGRSRWVHVLCGSHVVSPHVLSAPHLPSAPHKPNPCHYATLS